MTTWTPQLVAKQGPRYQAIADCLAEDLRDGRLSAGEQLPTQRDLAERLGLTVGTISRAYAEAHRRGLLQGEVGRGTFVRDPGPRTVSRLESATEPPSLVDMGLNLPLYAEDPDLGDALRTLAGQSDIDGLLRYQPQRGSQRHRRAGAAWIQRHGYDIGPERVVVTAGAQHAIAVVLGTLCRPGDTVLTEPLTYPGLKTVAALLDIDLAAVPMDAEGVLPAELDRVARESEARTLYCMPTLHNPTTATMSRGRRVELMAVVAAHDLRVIEDDVHGLLAPDAPPPLASLAPDRVHYIASTSKVLAGGLRVAYVAVPANLVERIAFAVAASLWVAPPLTAELAAMWIEDGTADNVAERKRDETSARQELARTILPADSFRASPPSYFLWLELPPPWQAESFALAARQLGVVVVPAAAFTVDDRSATAAVRVSLSGPRHRDEVEKGLRVLAELLARGPAPEPAIV